ncbi:MAG: hypothetical protein V3T30_02560 [Thermodesulfobacteriota bacterium]
MRKTLRLTRNDFQPSYYGTIVDSAGTPIDLTGASLVFTMVKRGETTPKVSRATVTVTDPLNAEWQYDWQGTDTDSRGVYDVEVEVTPATGGKFTVGMGRVIIRSDLDET